MMWVRVSNDCIGCGACALLSPEVFEIYKNSSIPNQSKISGHEEQCLDAAINCPVGAITIDEW